MCDRDSRGPQMEDAHHLWGIHIGGWWKPCRKQLSNTKDSFWFFFKCYTYIQISFCQLSIKLLLKVKNPNLYTVISCHIDLILTVDYLPMPSQNIRLLLFPCQRFQTIAFHNNSLSVLPSHSSFSAPRVKEGFVGYESFYSRYFWK